MHSIYKYKCSNGRQTYIKFGKTKRLPPEIRAKEELAHGNITDYDTNFSKAWKLYTSENIESIILKKLRGLIDQPYRREFFKYSSENFNMMQCKIIEFLNKYHHNYVEISFTSEKCTEFPIHKPIEQEQGTRTVHTDIVNACVYRYGIGMYIIHI